MASKPFPVVDLSAVSARSGASGGDTAAVMAAITRAISDVEDVARKVAPPDSRLTDLLFQLLSQRGSGSGPTPTPAPALPPTSTLMR